MPDLAAGVLALADGIAHGAAFHYAGDSVGGAVGLQLLLDAPERLSTATLLCTGAAIGRPEDWVARAATVRASGTGALVEMAAERWFAAGFIDREPAVVEELVGALRGTDDESYAQACEALADFDVTDRLPRSPRQCWRSPVPRTFRHHRNRWRASLPASRTGGWSCSTASATSRLPRHPAGSPSSSSATSARETPSTTRAWRCGATCSATPTSTAPSRRTTEFTAEFQDLITRYAWGTIWTRPGLDRRSRSMITLTALVARGHHEELAMHVRAARRNGLTNDEIKEVLLQTAIYCGVPDANSAFRIANQVLADYDARADEQ